ncbi:MAG: hypothetical protein JXQ79_04250 [Rhodobacteraceae bacterium]|nr:hypothetical protein [Paracoccaceae bacterium]
MTTPTYFLLSSMLYALIPVVIFLTGESPLNDALLVTLLTVTTSGFVALRFVGQHNVRKALFDPWLLGYSVLNLAGFFGFMVLMAQAKTVSNPIFALVAAEAWPIFSAVLFPLFRIGRTRPLSPFDYAVGGFALFGLILVAGPSLGAGSDIDVGLEGIALPILAMLAMAFGSAFKAVYVQRAKHCHGVGPVLSFFLMYAQIVPLLPLMPVFLDMPGAALTIDSAWLAPALIFVINVASAIAFSFGTLKISRSTDLFIWFFTPVFSTLFFCLFTATLLTPLEAAGIGVIVGCNLLASLETEKRWGYRYGVAGLMVTGVLCIVLHPMEMAHYYDTLAVLVIFVTITLAFLLERVSTRSGQEAALYSSAYTRAMHLDAPALRLVLQEIIIERNPYILKRKARHLSGLTDDMDVLEPVALICASRVRGLSVSNLFSVAFGLFAASVIAVTSRPVGWQHDVFVFCFVPSILYGFFYLVDLNAQRFTLPYYAYDVDGSKRISFSFDKASQMRQNSVWSIILILFLSVCFIYGFAVKHSLGAPYLVTIGGG